jgi:hypothetical protein
MKKVTLDAITELHAELEARERSLRIKQKELEIITLAIENGAMRYDEKNKLEKIVESESKKIVALREKCDEMRSLFMKKELKQRI